MNEITHNFKPDDIFRTVDCAGHEETEDLMAQVFETEARRPDPETRLARLIAEHLLVD